MTDSSDHKFATKAIHAGYKADATGSPIPPIHQAAAYLFRDADHGAQLFALEDLGYSYSRMTNPTNDALQQRLAALEGGVGATVTASGLAAQMLAFLAVMSPGKEIVASSKIYGGSVSQLKNTFPHHFGWNTKFVDPSDAQNFADAITENTRCIFIEALANPSNAVADIAAVAEVARAHGLPLIVDNTIATPYLCQPIEHGANIVTHSTTKYLAGNGTAVGGAIVDAGNFDWAAHADKFPQLARPNPAYNNLVFTQAFGRQAFQVHNVAVGLRDCGPAQAPFQSWLTMLGMETLHLRMERHAENALKVAQFLKGHKNVEWVSYSGLPDSPYHNLARRYIRDGKTSSLFTFGIKGGFEEGKQVMESADLFSMLPNIGDTRSLIIHPASTTHSQLSAEQMKAVGVNPETIRLSVGLEDIEDIIANLDQALKSLSGKQAA